MKKVAIIGGGITGLAAAYTLQRHGRGSVQVTLIESGSRLGGKIASDAEAGFLVEGGPDSFISQKPAGLALCRELNLADQLIGSNPEPELKTTYVASGGRLHPMPEGMMLMAPTMMLPFLRSRLFSWRGKLRMGLELFIPRRTDTSADESLASFVSRRLGNEALEKIAAPLMAGIYAADPAHLSLQSTFPTFLEMERTHGSLLRAMLKRKKAPRPTSTPGTKPPSMFMTLQGGLQQLVDALIAQLDPASIQLNRQILSITRQQGQYHLTFSGGEHIVADEIICCTPAYVTADLLHGIAPKLAHLLKDIRYVSTATVSLGYKRSEIKHALKGFGFVVPHSEGRRITACSWSSTKFSHRSTPDTVLLRAFVGGARNEQLAEQTEHDLVQMVRDELASLMGITATPILTRVYRWRKANPQYDVGHLDRVAQMEALAADIPGLHLAGAAFRGPGIPDCIQSAQLAAQSILDQINVARKEAV